jgi:hypothetical protein
MTGKMPIPRHIPQLEPISPLTKTRYRQQIVLDFDRFRLYWGRI